MMLRACVSSLEVTGSNPEGVGYVYDLINRLLLLLLTKKIIVICKSINTILLIIN
jgi:hypothetical protein